MGNSRAIEWEAAPVPATQSELETLRPILSRLPLDEPQEPSTDLDYIETGKVLYTQSRLPELDSTSRQLWQALHLFRATTLDYALLPTVSAPHPIARGQKASACPAFGDITASVLAHVAASFNWSHLPELPLEDEGRWYGVLFHSVRKLGSENANFYRADRLAHEEAVRSGGLIMYWYGTPHPRTGYNLATCIWTSRAEAIQASKLPLHAVAAKFAGPSYERYDLMRYTVVKRKGDPHLHIAPWDNQ